MGIFRKKELGPAWARAFIGRWPSLFSTDDDADWAEWVDVANTSATGLKALATDPSLRLSIRARAVYLLLVPDSSWAPFYWKSERRYSMQSSWPHDWLSQLSDELVELAAACAVTFREHVGGFSRAQPDTSLQGLCRNDAATDLNRVILELLGLRTSAETRERLLASYSLLDEVIYWNMDSASGYEPYERLMSDQRIDERWKYLAEAKMRAIVLAELSGERTPEAEHEAALNWYKNQVERSISQRGQMDYSPDLLASQLNFVLDCAQKVPDLTFLPMYVDRLYTALHGPEYLEVRHRLARHVVLGQFSDHHKYRISGVDDIPAGAYMQTEFAESDPELTVALQALYREWTVRHESERAASDALTHRYEAALARLH